MDFANLTNIKAKKHTFFQENGTIIVSAFLLKAFMYTSVSAFLLKTFMYTRACM